MQVSLRRLQCGYLLKLSIFFKCVYETKTPRAFSFPQTRLKCCTDFTIYASNLCWKVAIHVCKLKSKIT